MVRNVSLSWSTLRFQTCLHSHYHNTILPLTIYSIIFIHGLRGHPKETWATPAAGTQSSNGKAAKKHHGIRSFFTTNKKQPEVPPDEASTHSHGTDSGSDQTIFWIEDFLPRDIPNARILTYGYNADVIGLFQANNKNSVSQHGRDLKAKLERELDNEVIDLAG